MMFGHRHIRANSVNPGIVVTWGFSAGGLADGPREK